MPLIILGFAAAALLLNRLGHWKDFEKRHPNYGAQNDYPPEQPKPAPLIFMPGRGWIRDPRQIPPEEMSIDESSKGLPRSSQEPQP